MSRLLGSPGLWVALVAVAAFGPCIRSEVSILDEDLLRGLRRGAHLSWADLFSPDLFSLLPKALQFIAADFWDATPTVLLTLSLAVHVAVCLMALSVLRELLEKTGGVGGPAIARRAAAVGALLLACHPLAGDAVFSPARFGLVCASLFTLTSVRAAIRFADRPQGDSLVALCGTGILASISHPLGLWMAGGAAVFTLFMLRQAWRGRVTAWPPGAGILGWLVVGIGSGLGLLLASAGLKLLPRAGGQEFLSNLLTQGRCFWAGVCQMHTPVDLCPAHLVPWSTTWQDWPALLGALGALAVAAFCACLIVWSRSQRGRLVGGLLLLAVLPLLLCFFFPSPFPRVEARSYPALPWAMLLAGLIVAILLERWRALMWPLALGLVGTFFFLSVQQSALRADADQIAEHILKQYPDHLSVRVHLQKRLAATRQFTEVIRRNQQVLDSYRSILAFNATNPHRRQHRLIDAFRWRLQAEAVMIQAMTANFGPAYAAAYGKKASDGIRADAVALAANNPEARALAAVLSFELAQGSDSALPGRASVPAAGGSAAAQAAGEK